MKLAWLVYQTEEDLEENTPSIIFAEPFEWCYHQVIPIVYTEIEE